MNHATLRWGDGFLIVEPAYPDLLLKRLKYWRRTLEWNEEQMRRIANGSYEELYSVRTWIDQNTQQLNQQLSTMPGFMHRVKSVLREAGWTFTVKDERTPMPKPDLMKACSALYDYQCECAYTAIMSGGGIIACPTGWGKCLGADELQLYYDGSVHKADDVKVGDLLMGPDSRPRRVLARHDGFGPLYVIEPINGRSFVVADHHILTLVKSGNCKRDKYPDGHVVNITVADYLRQSNTFKHRYKLYRVAVNYAEQSLPLDPYFLGLWLGDGTWNRPTITTADTEIVTYLASYAASLGLRLVHTKADDKTPQYGIVGIKNHANAVLDGLRALGLAAGKNKFIPHICACNNRVNRLRLLAGLLDSDGSLNEGTDFDYIGTNPTLVHQVGDLARGLGFRVHETHRECTGFGLTVDAYRLRITGDTASIPTLVKRKQARRRKQKKDWLRTGFTVTPLARPGHWVGVEVDGDMLHLLDDCTVLHNTHQIAAICKAFNPDELRMRGTPLTVVTTPDKDITEKDFYDLKELMPDREVGLVMSGRTKFCDDVQVITLDSLHRLDPDEVGIVIVDEVHAAASDERAKSLLAFRKAAKWGVSATPTGRFDGRDLVTEGLFGPVVYTRSYADGVKDGALVPITVYWIECPEPQIGMDKYNAYSSRDGRYRQGVWRNEGRNAMIGEILKRLPPQTQALCIMQYLDQMNRIYPHCGPGVETVHAQTDGDELARCPNLAPITPKERKIIYQRMKDAEIKRILSTHVYKQGVNFPHLEVVINAGGGGSDIVAKQIPGRESRKTKTKARSFLIDFWHPWDTAKDKRERMGPGPVHADDQSREKAYTQLGFDQIWIKDLTQLPLLQGSPA